MTEKDTLTVEELRANIEQSVLFRLVQELRLAAAGCPQCEGSREYVFPSRGRENIVPCVRCEAVYKFLEPLEACLEVLRADSPY